LSLPSMWQRFLYQKGRGSPGSERCSRVSQGFRSFRKASRCNCRKGLALSIRVMTVAGFPLRQWLIGLSGLACGMTAALLIR
jgi:hypothetical protein